MAPQTRDARPTIKPKSFAKHPPSESSERPMAKAATINPPTPQSIHPHQGRSEGLRITGILSPGAGGRCRGTDGKFPLLSLWIFDPNVGKLPEILVERGDGSVFGSGRSGE